MFFEGKLALELNWKIKEKEKIFLLYYIIRKFVTRLA